MTAVNLPQGWPNADHSRFVAAGGLTWHVQQMGDTAAPGCLLVHGTGASTHSWRDVMPALAKSMHVTAIDLPGHGFTSEGRGRMLTLPGMAAALGKLLDELGITPAIGVGHSAGAAILIEMVLTGVIAPNVVIGLNSALEPIENNALFAPLAKALFVSPFTAHAVAMQARYTPMTRKLLARTNSRLDDAGTGQYETLVAMPSHVAGALGMMANWDLQTLRRRLPELTTPLTLIVNEDDPMVAASVSRRTAQLTKSAIVLSEPEGGHIAHEAEPIKYAELIAKIAADAGVPDRARASA